MSTVLSLPFVIADGQSHIVEPTDPGVWGQLHGLKSLLCCQVVAFFVLTP